MKYSIVHFNTPELTTCLISSIKKWDKEANIYIFENSNKRPLIDIFGDLTIFDNTKEQLINFNSLINEAHNYLSPISWNAHLATIKINNFGSMKHAASIQWLIEHIKDNFLLLDSDVLLKKSPLDLNTDKICSGSIDKFKDGKIRIAPYICFLNYNKLIENNILFFNIKTFDANSYDTDTGGTFLKDIKNKNILFNEFIWQDYCVHFGNGSWRQCNSSNLLNANNGTYKDFLIKYSELWK